MTTPSLEATRRSWNAATRNHNAHKGDQARTLREGAELLFPEELSLLGDLSGQKLVHLQCNSGQDSLCLARRGAHVTGVDFSDEAIGVARRLSTESGIEARFVEREVVSFLETAGERYDVAFSSYGVVGWLPDLDAWARGLARVLVPGGRFVLVEFHPIVWSFGANLRLTADDYFATAPFLAPVSDYVAAAGAALGAVEPATVTTPNTEPATSYQHGLGETVSALARAGLVLEELHEYPHSNGARLMAGLVPAEGRRYEWPAGAVRLPLMFGLVARRPTLAASR